MRRVRRATDPPHLLGKPTQSFPQLGFRRGAPMTPADLNPPKPLRAIQWASLMAAVCVLVTLSLHKLCSYDVWIHLSAGRLIASTGRVPRTDPFSYGAGIGRPWLDHEWLAQLAFYLTFNAGGPLALLILQAVVVAAGALCAAAVVAQRAGLAWAAVVPALVALIAYPRFLARPEVFAFGCAGAMLWCLSCGRGVVAAARRLRTPSTPGRLRLAGLAWLVAVAAIQVVWANTHPSFPVGVGMGIAFALGAIFNRPTEPARKHGWGEVAWLAAGALVAAVACSANPQGLALWLHPFRQLGASAYMSGVGEWKPLLSKDVGGLWRIALSSTAVLGLSGFALNWRSPDIAQTLVFLGAGMLSGLSARHAGLAAFLMAPIAVCRAAQAANRLTRCWPKWPSAVASCVLAVACAGMSYLASQDFFYHRQKCARHWGVGLDNGQYPVKAVDFVEAANLRGPMFNNYDVGGYLMWRLGPRRRVLIDGRNMVFGEDLYREYRLALVSWPRWRELAKRHGFEWVVLRHTSVDTDNLLHGLYSDPLWALCHFDETGVVFVRRDGVNAAAVKAHERDLVDVPQAQRARPDVDALLKTGAAGQHTVAADLALGGFFRKIGLYYRASEYLAHAVRQDPRDPQALSDLGGLYFKLDFRPAAERLFRAALGHDPRLFSARVNLAKLCALTGRFDKAIGHYRLVLRGRPEDARLHNNLATAYAKKGDLTRALNHYRQALAIAPSYRIPAYNLASILIGKGQFEQAAAVCRRLLRDDPHDAAAKSLMGRIESQTKAPPARK